MFEASFPQESAGQAPRLNNVVPGAAHWPREQMALFRGGPDAQRDLCCDSATCHKMALDPNPAGVIIRCA